MIHSTTATAITAAMSMRISRPILLRYDRSAPCHNEPATAVRLPRPDAVQHLGKGPECRARPAPHAATAPQDGSGRIAADTANVQRLVQLDQPYPELGEASHLLPRLGKERQVVRGEPGRYRNYPVPVDEPCIVAARLEPGRGVLGVQPHRLQVFPQARGVRIQRARLRGSWLGRPSLRGSWLGRPCLRECILLGRRPGGQALPVRGEHVRRHWRCPLLPRVLRGMPGPSLPGRLLVLLIWLRLHQRAPAPSCVRYLSSFAHLAAHWKLID